jgi:hypothetical protein
MLLVSSSCASSEKNFLGCSGLGAISLTLMLMNSTLLLSAIFPRLS